MVHEIECPECGGDGELVTVLPEGGREVADCAACAGEGWRPMTDEELACEAERQAEERAEAGWTYPTLDEQHRAAWAQKMELRS